MTTTSSPSASSSAASAARTAAKKPRFIWQGALLLGTIALLPAATGAMATVDAETQSEIEQFFEIYNRVQSSYVEEVDSKKLLRGAINGMLGSLDPHSAYLDAGDYTRLRTQIDGEFGGLGIQVTMERSAVKVIAPIADTPAHRAGIKPGDFISHIDGELIVGKSLDDAVSRMRGEPGTTLTASIVRQGYDKPIDVEITREIISLTPVKWKLKGDVAVISISNFSANVTRDVRLALGEARQELGRAPQAYILDLRSNPGGLLPEALGVSDLFLNKGEIVSQRGRGRSNNEEFYARRGDLAHGKPLVVLVNVGSASASEIVAGALQDHRRAIIMGERSFGKGSVQTVLPIDDETALRLTTARYYTPSGRSVQEGGISPDIKVPQLSDPDYRLRPRVRESSLLRHFVNESGVDDSELEKDTIDDPIFSATAEELKEKEIDDFQLHYALQTIQRITIAQAQLNGDAAPRTAQIQPTAQNMSQVAQATSPTDMATDTTTETAEKPKQ